MITCRLCQASFDKIITSTHLKHKHQISSADYKKQFGADSLACSDYKSQRSKERSGVNNPMFGKTHTDQTKTSISSKNAGKTPHNKGAKVTDVEQLKNLRNVIRLREEHYEEIGRRPQTGKLHSNETRERIRTGVKKYAENNPEILIDRAKKGQQTKSINNYYENQKKITEAKYKTIWNDLGYDVEFIGSLSKITHITCQSTLIRSTKSAVNPTACETCYSSQVVSIEEKNLVEWLKTITSEEIITNDKSILGNGFEIDIYFPKRNIAIEFNGLYWHSEEVGKGQWYHRTKTDKCKEIGIRLIHIFEDEWISKQHIVKNRLLYIFGLSPKIVSGARKCDIKRISIEESRKFHTSHHIQGYGNGTICYGLFYIGNLVSVMDFATLSKVKGARPLENVWELTRFSSNGSIPGAANKLFVNFVKDYDPLQVISYSDIRWNTGEVYKNLGMKKSGSTVPGYWYVKGVTRYHRWKFRKDQLVKQGHDANLTEKEIMKSLGYKRIWDCGHDKWIWSKK